MLFNQISVIGVGLIGGSMARALKKHDPGIRIVGSGRSMGNLEKALELGVIDAFEQDSASAVKGSDLVIIATPVGTIEQILTEIKDHIGAETIITDVGSTKASIIDAAKAVFGELPPRFIPGHPIAGTENSGVGASFAELFQNRKTILTPLDTCNAAALDKVIRMWEICGAEVIQMSVAHHDEVLAATSHLPHMLAFTLVDTLARLEDHDDIFKYAAGGFNDFTRIASSNPNMWHDICIHNRDALLKMLGRFSDELVQLAKLIEQGNSVEILNLFTRAKQARDEYSCNKIKPANEK